MQSCLKGLACTLFVTLRPRIKFGDNCLTQYPPTRYMDCKLHHQTPPSLVYFPTTFSITIRPTITPSGTITLPIQLPSDLRILLYIRTDLFQVSLYYVPW